MDTVALELLEGYRLVEKDVRAKYSEIFDHIEDELLERWLPNWKEHGFDTSKIRLKVTQRIEVSVVEDKNTETE